MPSLTALAGRAGDWDGEFFCMSAAKLRMWGRGNKLLPHMQHGGRCLGWGKLGGRSVMLVLFPWLLEFGKPKCCNKKMGMKTPKLRKTSHWLKGLAALWGHFSDTSLKRKISKVSSKHCFCICTYRVTWPIASGESSLLQLDQGRNRKFILTSNHREKCKKLFWWKYWNTDLRKKSCHPPQRELSRIKVLKELQRTCTSFHANTC